MGVGEGEGEGRRREDKGLGAGRSGEVVEGWWRGGPFPGQDSNAGPRKGERTSGSEVLGAFPEGEVTESSGNSQSKGEGGAHSNRGLYSLQIRNKTESLVSTGSFP